MMDEVQRTANALRIVADTQQRHEDRYGAWNFLRRVANLIEKLAAESDRWKARCETAERDMKTLADTINWIDSELPCSLCTKYRTLCPSRDTCFQWRGVQEEEADE